MLPVIASGFIALAGDNPGIFTFDLTTDGFDLSPRLASLDRVNTLVTDGRHSALYVASSVPVEGEQPSGTIVRYRFDRGRPQAGLARIADSPSGGTTPCHLAVVDDRLYVANFRAFGALGGPGATSQGSLGVIRVGGEDDFVLERSVRFPGSGAHPSRQTCSHPHCVLPFIDNSILVADLGADRIWRYRLGADQSYSCALELPSGSGPRHLALSPDGRYLYVVNEITSTVCTCSVGPEGELRLSGEVSTLPAPARGGGTGCDVAVAGDGTLVVATSRGQHSVAVVAAGDRDPVVLNHLHLDASPGEFALTATGFLLVPAGSTLVVCGIDERSGAIRRIGTHELPGRITALCCRH